MRLPWEDVQAVSLHGRQQISKVFNAVKEKDLVAVYTDPRHHPGWLASNLLEKGYHELEICVLEQLGHPEERMGWYSLNQAADMQFTEPNLTVLRRIDREENIPRMLFLGSPECCFEHEGGLITKAEIRAITLSKLRLKSNHIFWDLGAGSGSVAIEATLFIKRGKIFAVEQNADRVVHIKQNKKRFQLRNVSVIHKVLPDGLEALPDPDRIFIGGGGKRLSAIIDTASRRLKPEGIIVINTVIIENLGTAIKTLRKLGFKTDMVQIQVHRSHKMPYGERLEAENPVWVISGERECHEFQKPTPDIPK
jgi:precorrin-6Y C5,15-methyltransferase (decarboxylating)